MEFEANMPRAIMPSTAPPTAAATATAMTTSVSICTSRPAWAPEVVDRWCGVVSTGTATSTDGPVVGDSNTGYLGSAARNGASTIWDVAYYGAAGRAAG